MNLLSNGKLVFFFFYETRVCDEIKQWLTYILRGKREIGYLSANSFWLMDQPLCSITDSCDMFSAEGQNKVL